MRPFQRFVVSQGGRGLAVTSGRVLVRAPIDGQTDRPPTKEITQNHNPMNHCVRSELPSLLPFNLCVIAKKGCSHKLTHAA